jgi:hypothetical protein
MNQNVIKHYLAHQPPPPPPPLISNSSSPQPSASPVALENANELNASESVDQNVSMDNVDNVEEPGSIKKRPPPPPLEERKRKFVKPKIEKSSHLIYFLRAHLKYVRVEEVRLTERPDIRFTDFAGIDSCLQVKTFRMKHFRKVSYLFLF